MNRVLLFGGTGHLGKAIATELKKRGIGFTAVVRNEEKAGSVKEIATTCHVADITRPDAIRGICAGFETVISTLGKSVSPNDNSRPTFRDIDLDANTRILDDARKSGVKKFVYVSAFHSERYQHLDYFMVHHEFSERLKASGTDYSIIKPPALFSAFLDLIDMAKKGRLMNVGKGEGKTNPIWEGDLAAICVDAVDQPNVVIEVGGKTTYTRKQLNTIVQQAVDPSRKARTIPLGLLKSILPLIKIFSKNTYDKFAFFTEVLQHDVLAPPVGEMSFEEYVKQNLISDSTRLKSAPAQQEK